MQPSRIAKLALIAAIPTALIGWALFRPELLFVNQTVNEKAPSASQASEIVAKGSFTSYAHETKGNAQILNVDGKRILRLTDFHTSNGPDVRVYLLKGNDSASVKEGEFIDLGSIKGNIGDQNYEIPAGAGEFGAVAIWCKRFSVGFGGATLEMDKETAKEVSFSSQQPLTANWNFASFAEGAEIRVTSGAFRADTPGLKGAAELLEDKGKRFLRVSNLALGSAMTGDVWLVKKETIPANGDISGFTKVKLGTVKKGTARYEFSVAKDLDVWLYRSVTITAPGQTKSLGTAPLRSDQEKPKRLI